MPIGTAARTLTPASASLRKSAAPVPGLVVDLGRHHLEGRCLEAGVGDRATQPVLIVGAHEDDPGAAVGETVGREDVDPAGGRRLEQAGGDARCVLGRDHEAVHGASSSRVLMESNLRPPVNGAGAGTRRVPKRRVARPAGLELSDL